MSVLYSIHESVLAISLKVAETDARTTKKDDEDWA